MELRLVTNEDNVFFSELFEHETYENKFIEYYRNVDEWLKLVDNNRRVALLVVLNDRPIGFADIEFDGSDGCSFAFGLLPSMRGRGLGVKLVQTIELFCKNKGANTIQAGVDKENIACIKLLQKSGYSVSIAEDNVQNFIKII